MRLTELAAAVGGAVALVGYAGAARADATIDLIWAATGTNEITDLDGLPVVILQVILTAGPEGSSGAGVSVGYSGAPDAPEVLEFTSTPGGQLPLALGETIDTGSRIENINSYSLPPEVGTGLSAGQSHQLGTITFHKGVPLGGVYEIRSDANGPIDGVFDLDGIDISERTTFNSAFLIPHEDPPVCDFAIEVNSMRGGSPTVTVNDTKNITAKARIIKGTAPSDTTLDATLRIDAIDGSVVIDSQYSGPIRLEVGKGGRGDKLAMNINQCNSGAIDFVANFFGTDSNDVLCEASRRITKTCN
jgi:hypothetical protein